jgi:hypothetical protein
MTTTDVAIIKGGFFALFQLLTLIDKQLQPAVQKIMWHYVAKKQSYTYMWSIKILLKT